MVRHSLAIVMLDRPRTRLDRAKVHYQQFGEVWNSFTSDEEAYYPIITTDDKGEGAIFVRAAESFPGEQLALHFGEMLYQLRAALDSLIYEVAILDSGKTPLPMRKTLNSSFEGPRIPSTRHPGRSSHSRTSIGR